MSAKILIVDDEADIRNLIKGILDDEGYDCRVAESSKACDEAMAKELPALIILDIWLQGSEHDGLEILKRVKNNHPHMPVIMISGHGTIETAVSAIKQGAYDFVEKPFKSDRLLLMIRRGLENAALLRENTILKQGRKPGMAITGKSQAAQTLDSALHKVATSNSRVFLTGERGTGKEMAAGLIHQYSPRADEPFIALDCHNLAGDDHGAALFGADDVIGAFEQARDGTLYMGYVELLGATLQGKLLKALQGSISEDVRMICGAGQDMQQRIAQGAFRDDLFAQLNVTQVEVPPLRLRSDDIPALLSHFMHGKADKIFTKEALETLQSYKWPGNVRQLRHVAQWVDVLYGEEARPYAPEHLPLEVSGLQGAAASSSEAAALSHEILGLPLREAREAFEKDYLLSQIDRFEGNISKTAQFIGMERSALHRKIKNLNVYQPDSEDSSGSDIENEPRKRA